MNPFLIRILLPVFLSCATAMVTAEPNAVTKHRIDLPPSVELQYAIKARQKGIAVDGDAVVGWSTSGKEFTVTTETRAMLIGKILDARSEGAIDEFGLAPASFREKRFRKEPTSTSFNRTAKTISFNNSSETYALKGGEQDRSSAVWQLVSIARGSPAKFKPSSEWTFIVAGQRDAEPWKFKVLKEEKIQTGTGEMDTLHISRELSQDSKDNQLDIWLAPALEWYPVRLRFSEENGDFIEQTLKQANRKSG